LSFRLQSKSKQFHFFHGAHFIIDVSWAFPCFTYITFEEIMIPKSK
jgi:hypothetical protein